MVTGWTGLLPPMQVRAVHACPAAAVGGGRWAVLYQNSPEYHTSCSAALPPPPPRTTPHHRRDTRTREPRFGDFLFFSSSPQPVTRISAACERA